MEHQSPITRTHNRILKSIHIQTPQWQLRTSQEHPTPRIAASKAYQKGQYVPALEHLNRLLDVSGGYFGALRAFAHLASVEE